MLLFHDFKKSDRADWNTRVRMQWACSHFFPPSVMAAHVTNWEQRPIEFACAVALSGRFGIDLDLAALSDNDLVVLRRAVAVARRTQPVVQQGELVRLVSPVGDDPARPGDRSRGAIASIAPDGRSAVMFAYQLEDASSGAAGVEDTPVLALPQLDPDCIYTVTETDLNGEVTIIGEFPGGSQPDSFSTDWPLTRACTARIWEYSEITLTSVAGESYGDIRSSK